jgi:hypothetical protein
MTKPIRELIQATGLTQAEVAVSAGIALATVNIAAVSGQWPSQRRTRHALARVLGLTADPETGLPLPGPAGIPINTVEQARAVLAQRGLDVGAAHDAQDGQAAAS